MKTVLYIYILIFCSVQIINAQQNTDSIFSSAIAVSKNQQFDNSIKIAKYALSTDTKRGDIMVFIANVYSWQLKNDSALIYIKKAKSINYQQADLYETWTNILMRSHQYDLLLESCNIAEQNNYSSADILKKRLIAYTELKAYSEGVKIAEAPKNKLMLKQEPFNSLYNSLLIKRNTHIVSANYSLDVFDNDPSRHLGSLGYSFQLGQHTLAPHINWANRFGKNDLQIGTDFYLQMVREQYFYFNYDYSIGSILFPRHRLGVEYYFPLKYKREASLGMRFMGYQNSQVFIFTGHLGKYFGRNFMDIRPFYVTQKSSKSLTLIGTYKYFGKNELNYWGLELGFGNSPDDIFANSAISSFNQLNAYKIKVEKNFMLNRISDFRIGLGYISEEYDATKPYRNRFTIDLGYKIRLR
jgi:YaiO family outer membrane protein